MSRTISATNVTELTSASNTAVILVKLEYGTPVYVHSGTGTLTYDGDDYTGVGDYGGISGAGEREELAPSNLTLSLTGITAAHVTEALDSGSYGDAITIYQGYLDENLTLVDDPWVVWSGQYEYASIGIGKQSAVQITVKHDLASLDEKDGGRYTDEDQQTRFSGDVGLEYVTDQQGLKLTWGGGRVFSGQPGGNGGGFHQGQRDLR